MTTKREFLKPAAAGAGLTVHCWVIRRVCRDTRQHAGPRHNHQYAMPLVIAGDAQNSAGKVDYYEIAHRSSSSRSCPLGCP
jgi:hypothetical protein